MCWEESIQNLYNLYEVGGCIDWGPTKTSLFLPSILQQIKNFVGKVYLIPVTSSGNQ